MTIRISGVAGRHGHINLTIEGVELTPATDLKAFVDGLEDGSLSILAHHLRARMEERGFAWNPRYDTPEERADRGAPPLATKDGDKPWRSPGGAGQWNG